MAALTGTQARQMSRRFADVGVELTPRRLQRNLNGAHRTHQESVDIEFAMITDEALRRELVTAVQAHRRSMHREPTPQEWMASALRVLLQTIVTTAAGLSAVVITFVIVAVAPVHGIAYLIEHQFAVDPHNPAAVPATMLDRNTLTLISTVAIYAVGGVLALGVGLYVARKVMEALPRRGDAPRKN